MPRVELVLKRSIPLLILAFLAVIAASRSLGIVSEHTRMEDAARQSTSLMAAAAVASFAGHEVAVTSSDRKTAEAQLARFLPQDRLHPEAFLLLVDPSGTIFGSSTASPYIGQRLVSVLPETAALRRFGNSGLIQTYIGGEPHYAAIQPVGHDGGLIIAARSLASINYFWRHEVSLNVTLFACISA